MVVTLDAATAQRIQREIELGHARDAAEVIGRAVGLLDFEKDLVAQSREALTARLGRQHGAGAGGGEFYTPAQARAMARGSPGAASRMSEYRLTVSAIDDLDEILRGIDEQSGWEFAIQVEEQLFAKFEARALDPGRGLLRPDLTRATLRFFAVDPYLIAYQHETSPMLIVAILHSPRDGQRMLHSRAR